MNLDPRFVPVETDLKEIPKIPKGVRRTDHEIKKVYSDFEFKKEQEYMTPRPLRPEEQTIIRSPQSVAECVREMREAMDKSGKDKFILGLDQEKNLSTLQLSLKIDDYFGKGKHYEKNVLFHMRTVLDCKRNIMVNGVPPDELKEFLCDKRLIFSGKSIREDIKYVVEEFKIDPAIAAEMEYIELGEVYDFVFNFLWSPDYASDLLKCDQKNHKERQRFWSCLDDVGLKTIYQFAFPGMTISKRMVWRDHKNNFDEWRGKIKPEELVYAINDAIVSREIPIEICENLLGIRATLFRRKYGSYELAEPTLLRLLDALSDPAVLGSLDSREKAEAESLREAWYDERIRAQFMDNQFNVRLWMKKRNLCIARLRTFYELKQHEVEYGTATEAIVYQSRPALVNALLLMKELQRKKAPRPPPALREHDDNADVPMCDLTEDEFWGMIDRPESAPAITADSETPPPPTPARAELEASVPHTEVVEPEGKNKRRWKYERAGDESIEYDSDDVEFIFDDDSDDDYKRGARNEVIEKKRKLLKSGVGLTDKPFLCPTASPAASQPLPLPSTAPSSPLPPPALPPSPSISSHSLFVSTSSSSVDLPPQPVPPPSRPFSPVLPPTPSASSSSVAASSTYFPTLQHIARYPQVRCFAPGHQI